MVKSSVRNNYTSEVERGQGKSGTGTMATITIFEMSRAKIGPKKIVCHIIFNDICKYMGHTKNLFYIYFVFYKVICILKKYECIFKKNRFKTVELATVLGILPKKKKRMFVNHSMCISTQQVHAL